MKSWSHNELIIVEKVDSSFIYSLHLPSARSGKCLKLACINTGQQGARKWSSASLGLSDLSGHFADDFMSSVSSVISLSRLVDYSE